MVAVQIVPTKLQYAQSSAPQVGIKLWICHFMLTTASGDANWVVECPSGTAVKEGDFCCSVSGTARTCCDTASNGLGLVAPVSSAQPTSATFVETSTVPASVCNGATTPSSQRIDGRNFLVLAGPRLTCMAKQLAGPSMPSSTPHFNLDLSKRLPGNVPTFTYTVTLAFFAIVISCAFVFGIIYFVLWNETPSTWTKVKGMIKHTFNRLTARLQRRQLGTINNDNYFAMNNFRDQSDGTSGSQAPVEPTERGISSEAEGSQANPAETNADGTPDPWLSAAPDSNLPTVPPPAATS